jgi:hypothetical protein
LVYSDNTSRYVWIAVIITVILVIIGYGFWGPQIDRVLRGSVLLSQVTPIVQLEQDYLLDLQEALAFLTKEEVASSEALQQRFIETLFIHVNEFDETKPAAAEKFLKEYYAFPEPIPPGVQGEISTSADKFIISYPIFAAGGSSTDTTTTTSTGTTTTASTDGSTSTTSSTEKDFQPFLDQIITILANHQVSTNNYQSVKRAQTIQSLMEAFANEL